ncbi:RHS repeat-associated core domain-containing protein [Bacteroidales bacterium OttesenSCG-928-K03]|nr:RHS repeat-associated core domain-containing protein [Odoribacter sp. OttesenSCG-928-L07]MDL2241010.1 RHS repeat-associated core domain-containing protein [Bacteroidales bacterium OttesenSCG-928-K22]MDL2242195.1 RHS repeat-associated core domain-containing protein [Bacteroidales bacterium OttesenSCG-928-K03]
MLSSVGNIICSNMSYDYLGDGNMHYRTDALIGKKEWFKYDNQNRLIGWETTSLNAAEPTYQTRISYTGNRVSSKENIGNFVYEDFPHHGVKTTGATTVENYPIETTYDHNRIDGRARVSALTRNNNAITYTYGTADDLIKKTEIAGNNSTTTYYAGGGKYELRIDNTTNSETKLLYLGSGVVKYDAPGTNDDKMLYLLKDHLGSIVKVLSINTNNNVTALESFSYDVWGNRRNAANWTSSNITAPQYIFKGFTGHEHIDNFGLIHMKGRVYDPALGMFLSPDPYVQNMTTMGFNRYLYCMGNPLMYMDPDGEFVTWSIGKNGFSIGLNFTPIGVPLGAGLNAGWGKGGFSLGGYVEVGYRAGGNGFGLGASVQLSYNYNFRYNNSSIAFTGNVYASAGPFGIGVSASASYNFLYQNWGLSWTSSFGMSFGIDNVDIGINAGYGSQGAFFDSGMGGAIYTMQEKFNIIMANWKDDLYEEFGEEVASTKVLIGNNKNFKKLHAKNEDANFKNRNGDILDVNSTDPDGRLSNGFTLGEETLYHGSYNSSIYLSKNTIRRLFRGNILGAITLTHEFYHAKDNLVGVAYNYTQYYGTYDAATALEIKAHTYSYVKYRHVLSLNKLEDYVSRFPIKGRRLLWIE